MAAALAAGKAMDTLRAIFEHCRAMLMGDIGVLAAAVRDEIMSEFDA